MRNWTPVGKRYKVDNRLLVLEIFLVYTKIWCRWWMFIERHLQLNLGFRLENVVFTGDGFSLNLGFRKILCSQEMDSVLFQVHKNLVYTRESSTTLYNCRQWYMVKGLKQSTCWTTFVPTLPKYVRPEHYWDGYYFKL